ncbi:vegetative cell wall protein gp1 [Leguminivora glycinivorella]|uniref:vegetative cell wall protein gp1 n=1 Tax=Leguminivora glycinivorella TaxID=1035111 RepID=UPI0020101A72|nr:vegetative cell wall protein gp1 [Leguminivora glycinivorella]
MTRLSLLLHIALLLGAACAAPAPAPAPGRVPKVYNALITSNQNLEPSKAYPVYQPVLHDPFGFPYSPFVYGDYPISNGLIPVPPPSPKGQPAPAPPAPSPESPPTPSEAPPEDKSPSSEVPPPAPEPQPESDTNKPTTASPLPPNTESPIPLNEFGLPSQVLPLGRINPAYNGFTQVGPFTYPYAYSGFRFYDPYDPFSFNPYANLPPLYRPLANTLVPQGPALVPARAAPVAPAPAQSADAPPSEPSDLNLLNYASKDPAIPNVPPPPLPSGGLKTDKTE